MKAMGCKMNMDKNRKLVMLINIPPNKGEKRIMGFQPLSLLAIGTFLESKGIPVVIIDARAEGLSFEDLLNDIETFDPFLVGIGTYTPFVAHAYNFSEILKSRFPNINVVLGGPHINATYPESMYDVSFPDFLIYGEGERPLYELLKSFDDCKEPGLGIKGVVYRKGSEIIVNKPQDDYVDLNEIPALNYDLIARFNINNYDSIFALGDKVMGMVVSRGCPFKCTFCGAQVTHGHKIRYMDYVKAVDEIEEKMGRYGVKYVSMKDSTFTVNRNWVFSFCEELRKRKLQIKWGCNARVDCIDKELLDVMVASGLVNLGFGIESGTTRILEVMKKGISLDRIIETIELVKQYDLIIGAGFMLGNISESIEEVKQTIRLAKQLRLPLTAFSSTVAYPGTPLHKQAIDSYVLKNERWYLKKTDNGKYEPVGLTAGNLIFDEYDPEEEVQRAYREFYFSPKYWGVFMKLLIKYPIIIKYGMFYFLKILQVSILKRKSQHI